jgi:hypothetical protein
MASTVKILLLYGQLKSVLKLESHTSLKELERKAASVFKIPRKVTLQQFDVDFKEWGVLDQDYVPQNKDQLQVIVADESGSIIQVEDECSQVQFKDV